MRGKGKRKEMRGNGIKMVKVENISGLVEKNQNFKIISVIPHQQRKKIKSEKRQRKKKYRNILKTKRKL